MASNPTIRYSSSSQRTDNQHQPKTGAKVHSVSSPSSPSSSPSWFLITIKKLLHHAKVESRGIEPVPLQERTLTQYFKIGVLWASINTNISGITFGMLGPLVYNLSLRDSALVILFFNMISCIAPGYLSTLGPRTGMRQMIQARYSFGRYLVSIPVLFNLATMIGFTVIVVVTGGQTLAAVSDGTLSPNAGIIIIGAISLCVSFCGFRVLHAFETCAFPVVLVAVAIAAGCGASGLARQQSQPMSAEEKPLAPRVTSFGMLIASYQIPWACLASDMTTYFRPKMTTRAGSCSWRVYWYTYLGLATPAVLLMTLGAAMGGAVPNNPDWQARYERNSIGGVLAAMLAPAGWFGRLVLVLLAFSVLGNTCGTLYSATLNGQTLLPWLARVPRCVFAIVMSVIVVAVAIAAVGDFFASIENVVSLIGYWSSQLCAIIIMEDLVFRRGRYRGGDHVSANDDDGDGGEAEYSHAIWRDASRLPVGVAAMVAAASAWALIIPCMDQTRFTGPLARTTGDIGFEVAFFLSGALYVPLRWGERRLSGR